MSKFQVAGKSMPAVNGDWLPLLGSWVAMFQELFQWIKAADIRAKAAQAAAAGEHKTAKEWADNAEAVAHDRRNRTAAGGAGWLLGLVIATALWQYQTGESLFTQLLVAAATGGAGGWVISRKETGPVVDTSISFLLLLVNVGTAWWVNSVAVFWYLAISAVGVVVAGVVWRLAHLEDPGDVAGVPVAVPTAPSGGFDDSAIVAAFAAAVPAIRSKLATAKKNAVKAGTVPEPVFSPFTVALSDDGTTSAAVKLPIPVTAGDLDKGNAMERFSGALGVNETQVVTRRGGHAGVVDIRILPKPVYEMPLPEWPHWNRRVLDSDRFCVGFNESGQPVMVEWSEANSIALVGMKGTGKTNSLRGVILGLASQSVWVRLHVFNGKGTGDFNVLNPILHTHVSGDDEVAAEKLLDFLKWMVKEASRRAEILYEHADKFPKQKFTPEDLGSKWGVFAERIIIDEVDSLIEHRPEIGTLLTKLGEKYRAAQFSMIFGLQSMINKSDSGLRAAAGSCDVKICHYVDDYNQTKAILGDGWAGPKPQTFRFPKTGNLSLDGKPIPGLAAIKGGSDELVRFPEMPLNHPLLERMIGSLREEREAKDALTGAAIGEASIELAEGERTIIHAALEVWPKDASGVPCPTVHRSWLAEALVDGDPDYTDMEPVTVSSEIIQALDADPGDHKRPPHDDPKGPRKRSFRHDEFLAQAFGLNDF